MISVIIWLALLCPNHNHTVLNHGDCTMMHVTTQSLDNTVGETGNFPPKPPVPPPPPPPGY